VLDYLETVSNELVGLPSWMIQDLDYLEFHFDTASAVNLIGGDVNKFYSLNNKNGKKCRFIQKENQPCF